jgi:competence protein ComEA
MKTMRWLGVVVLAMWCLSGGAVAGEDKPAKARAAGKVNINEASKAELMKLAGVGPGGAQKIIDYRAAHGPFQKAQDLEKVDGVGKGVLEKNAGRIVVK